MKKRYDVIVRYEGSIQYEVEAENIDDAKKVARKSFDEDGGPTIEANIENIEYDVNDVPQEEEPEQDEGTPPEKPKPEPVSPRMTPYERTKAAVYATGNRWAIENFESTHN